MIEARHGWIRSVSLAPPIKQTLKNPWITRFKRDKRVARASGVFVMRTVIIALLSCTLAACAQDSQVSSTLPTGAAAYSVISAPNKGQDGVADYRIGALD